MGDLFGGGEGQDRGREGVRLVDEAVHHVVVPAEQLAQRVGELQVEVVVLAHQRVVAH